MSCALSLALAVTAVRAEREPPSYLVPVPLLPPPHLEYEPTLLAPRRMLIGIPRVRSMEYALRRKGR